MERLQEAHKVSMANVAKDEVVEAMAREKIVKLEADVANFHGQVKVECGSSSFA